jgi:hypothetical protein
MEHKTADGYLVEQGKRYWDNDLNQVTVTKLAAYSEANQNKSHPDFGKVVWWHETTGGLVDGSRLARFHPFTREDAWDLYSVIGKDSVVMEVGLSKSEAEKMVSENEGSRLSNDGPNAKYGPPDTEQTFTVSVTDKSGNVIWSTDVDVDTAELPQLGDLGYSRKAAAWEAVTEAHYWQDRG